MSLLLALVFALAPPATGAAPPAAAETVAPPPRCGYRIVQTYPHDPSSFTQGLFWHDGHLYEGTGQYGRSKVARSSKAVAMTMP